MAAPPPTEDPSLYPNTELIFCNIDNIHIMRQSAAVFADALSSQTSGSAGGFFAKMEESGWLRHVRLIIMASALAAEKLHFEGASVLVHCSDGWDRTAQICSVAQLILDPHFRTIEGLAILIEKEWCAFGHKFQDRCGHGVDHSTLSDERSPVFLQFLDAVFQIVGQFPCAFEYTESLLLFLADHLHSCLFGKLWAVCLYVYIYVYSLSYALCTSSKRRRRRYWSDYTV
ncbi:Myotubularin-like phosphatase domain-containing protein [Ochromonadaceae sp. CCMP2298]|nr:Myotubularin-like phosphatase domain-containing protein [Ochromonadaceae sp. CCMP2298]